MQDEIKKYQPSIQQMVSQGQPLLHPCSDQDRDTLFSQIQGKLTVICNNFLIVDQLGESHKHSLLYMINNLLDCF